MDRDTITGSHSPLRPEQMSVILDSVAAGIFTIDMDWRITSFNRTAEDITGVPRNKSLGKPCWEVFKSNLCEDDCPIRQTIKTGMQIVNRAAYIVDSKGDRVPISMTAAPLRDEDRVIGGVETFRDLRQVEALRKRIEQSYCCEDILSCNHLMRRMFELLPTIADSDSTVCIEGETGTGKELVARAIHTLSPRKDKPFVAINCGALPDSLLESELFGYKAGAFTDAKRDKPGRCALAEGGTLLLDEIGDISPALQVRLLRVIQERVYEPLGATKPVETNVRIVAATNKNLDDLVRQGKFRHDLYYRINVVQLVLPPLRERKEDIPLLVDHFVARFNRLQDKDVAGVSERVMELLMAHDFPGNVRELENIIEHAFVLCQGGLIEPRHLPKSICPTSALSSLGMGRALSLEEMEKIMITDALRRNDWNRKAASRELRIHKSTLFRKIKVLGIDLPPLDGRSSFHRNMSAAGDEPGLV